MWILNVPLVPLTGMHVNDMFKDIWTKMFITGLFIVAKNIKGTTQISINRERKSWYIYKVEYYVGNQNKHLRIHIYIYIERERET